MKIANFIADKFLISKHENDTLVITTRRCQRIEKISSKRGLAIYNRSKKLNISFSVSFETKTAPDIKREISLRHRHSVPIQFERMSTAFGCRMTHVPLFKLSGRMLLVLQSWNAKTMLLGQVINWSQCPTHYSGSVSFSLSDNGPLKAVCGIRWNNSRHGRVRRSFRTTWSRFKKATRRQVGAFSFFSSAKFPCHTSYVQTVSCDKCKLPKK